MTNNNQTELLPAKTIEARWGITPDELRRAADNGQITEYRLGTRTLRYNPDEILDYMTRDTTSDTTTAPSPATVIPRPGLTTDDYDKLTYQDWLNLRAEWLRLASGPRPATVALSFDFMTTSAEPVGGDGPDIDPSQNQTTTRDRLARIISDLTSLHNQLPH